MVVATIGIQEIAHRVTDPLHLDGRKVDGGDEPGALVLADRTTSRGPTVDVADEPPAGALDGPAFLGGAPSGSLATSMTTAAPIVVEPAADDPGWEVRAAEGATTRWTRGATGADGQPEHHLEYLSPTRQWERGYGNDADTTLTTPWIDVPAGDGLLWIGIWSRMYVESEYDGYALAWTSDGTTWSEVDRISGGSRDDPVLLRHRPLDAAGAERVRLRLHFTSDRAGSAWDRDINNLAAGKGEHLDVHRIALIRTVGDSSPTGAIGAPDRALETAVADEPHVVVALSGESINPYHPQFRDTSPRAYAHPSTYLEGYPTTAIPVWLSLDAPDFATAMEQDRDKWDELVEHELYWFPGTRIIGAVTPTDHGASAAGCDPICIGATPRCPQDATWTFCDAEELDGRVGDRVEIWDWQADATGWASAAAGSDVGTCPDCLVVHVDSVVASAVHWPTEHAAWIDVQVHHHPHDGTVDATGNLYGECVSREDECLFDLSTTVHEAAARQLVVTNPEAFERADHVYTQPIAGAPGAVTVAGHDRGHVSVPREGSHVAANYCAVEAAADHSFTLATRGATWRMSTARAAGLYATILLEARRLLGDTGNGVRDGALAVGRAGRVTDGPLADGRLTMAEWRDVVESTATPRPPADPDGPRCHDTATDHHDDDFGPHGHAPPSSLGVPWRSLPDGAPTHIWIGYGAIDDPRAMALAKDVLHGRAPLPDRSDLDDWLARDWDLRMTGMQAREMATRTHLRSG